MVPTIWITVGQGPTALEVGAGGGCSNIFSLEYPFSPLSPSLWGTVRYRLKYHLNGPLDPKQSTNQSPAFELHYIQTDCVFKEVIEISGRKPNHQKHAVLYHLYFIFKLSIYSLNFSVEFFSLPWPFKSHKHEPPPPQTTYTQALSTTSVSRYLSSLSDDLLI